MAVSWYKRATGNITIRLDQYQQGLRGLIDHLAGFTQEQSEAAQHYQLPAAQLQQMLTQLRSPMNEKIFYAIESKNSFQVIQSAFQFFKWFTNDIIVKQDRQLYDFGYKVYEMLKEYANHLEYTIEGRQPWDKATVQKEVVRLVKDTYANMQKVRQMVAEAVSRIQDWQSWPIVIIAARPIKDNDYLSIGETDATIEMITGSSDNPNFTLFVHEDGTLEAEDVLDGGDDWFFPEGKGQKNYFDLISEITKPGSSNRPGKTIRVFTARPVQDRSVYEGAAAVPANIFVTSNPSSAEGIAMDLGGSEGRRDVWMMLIDSRYLRKTLDTGMEQQYQVMGQGQVPVARLSLYSEGDIRELV